MRKTLVLALVLALFVIGAAVAAKPQPARVVKVPCGIVVTIVCKVQAFSYPTFAPVKQKVTCEIASVEYICKPKQRSFTWIVKYDTGFGLGKR